jgi:Mg-chelatase subunit ChlI
MVVDEPNVVNVIIAKGLNLTSEDLQVQLLQLMRTRQLVTEIGILNAPLDFLLVPLVARDSGELRPPLKTHLVGVNDSQSAANIL